MEWTAGKLHYVKLTIAGFAFCGLFLAAFGLSTAHSDCKHNCAWFSYQWWVVGMEILALAFHAAASTIEAANKFHLPSVAFNILACMAIDDSLHTFVSGDYSTVGKNSAQTGFSVLLAVNIAAAAICSIDHYEQPKGDDVEEDHEKRDLEEGQSSQPAAAVEKKHNWSWLLNFRFAKMGLVTLGLAGTAAASVAYDQSCIEHYCKGKEFFWWVAAAEVVMLVGFVYTEVLLRMPNYRPVIALLSALHIPYLVALIDGMLWSKQDAWDWTYRKLVFAGCVLMVIVNFCILFLLQAELRRVQDPVSQSKVKCHFALPPALGAISGFMFAYIKETDPSHWSGFTWWGFSLELVVLMGVLVSLCPQVSSAADLRLPLVTLISIATFDPMVRVHNWVREDTVGCTDFCSIDDINGVGYLILVISHVLLILAMGWDCPEASEPCSGKSFLAKLFEKKDKVLKVETVPMSETADPGNNPLEKSVKSDHAINIQ